MNIGNQIREYRNQYSYSQEDLADKIYVTRQTISNWENDKTYPDVNSLVLLSLAFNTSIDNLIKGDLQHMKQITDTHQKKQFNQLSTLFSILFFLSIISIFPLFYFLKKSGYIIWLLIAIITTVVGFILDKQKKDLNIHTYQEILAFSEGKKLDEITKTKEEGKRPYQHLLAVIFTLLLGLIISLILIFWL